METENEPGGCATPLLDIAAVFLMAWGMAALIQPVIAKPRTVECVVPLSSNQFVSISAIGKGEVYE